MTRDAFQTQMTQWCLDGKPRSAQRFTTSTNCPLPTPEDRLLFILVYTLSRDFVGHLRISQITFGSLQRESLRCTIVLEVVSLWKVIVMAAFTLTQSEKDLSLFFVLGPDGTPVSDINAFLLHLSHLGRSAYTLRSYAQGLAHFFDWLHRTGHQVDEVTPQVIEVYITAFSLQAKGGACSVDPAKAGQINLLTRKATPGRERQPRTVNHRLSVLASFFAYRIQADTNRGSGSWVSRSNPVPANSSPQQNSHGMPGRDIPGEESEENCAVAFPDTFLGKLILPWPSNSSIQLIPGATRPSSRCCIVRGSESAIGVSWQDGTAFSA